MGARRRAAAGDVRPLLEEAALFNVLGAALAYPDAAGHERVESGFGRLRAAQPGLRGRGALARAVGAAHAAWSATPWADAAAEYARLFFGTAPAPLHETAYGDARRLGGPEAELADIRGFYAAFGFTLSAARPDLPDHLGAELEFVSLVLVKEAYAVTGRRRPQAEVARAAAAAFLRDHLGRWVPAWTGRLAACGAGEPWASVGRLVQVAVARACARRRLKPRPAAWRPERDGLLGDTFTCPRAAGS